MAMLSRGGSRGCAYAADLAAVGGVLAEDKPGSPGLDEASELHRPQVQALEAVADPLPGRGRDRDGARPRDGLQPRGKVRRLAEDRAQSQIAFPDEGADDDQPGGDADADLERFRHGE